MKSFTAPDFYHLDSHLKEEEKMVRDSVRDFVSAEVMPIIEKCHREGRFPKELIPGFAELGVLGASLHGYGCAGVNKTTYGLICQEIERGDSGLRSIMGHNGSASGHRATLLCSWLTSSSPRI